MATTVEQIAALMPDATDLLSDEPEMESTLHFLQLALLVNCLEFLWTGRSDYFIGANLTIYFNRQQLKTKDFRGPDFFLVRDSDNRPRASWVVWEEDGKYPDLIIELLSDSTAEIDRVVKKKIYQERFRTPEYFWFSPDTMEFMGFHLVDGKYVEIQPNDHGLRWSQVLGFYLGVHEGQLRYFRPDSSLAATVQEALQRTSQDAIEQAQAFLHEKARAEQALQQVSQETQRAEQALQQVSQETQRAEQETMRAEQEARRAEQETMRAVKETHRAERLATKLRELGIDPDAV